LLRVNQQVSQNPTSVGTINFLPEKRSLVGVFGIEPGHPLWLMLIHDCGGDRRANIG
jgi:hypothetical protein